MTSQDAKKIVYTRLKNMFTIVALTNLQTMNLKDPQTTWTYINSVEDAVYLIKTWYKNNSKYATLERKGTDLPLFVFRVK